jgi:hypothetical protein
MEIAMKTRTASRSLLVLAAMALSLSACTYHRTVVEQHPVAQPEHTTVVVTPPPGE